MNREQALALLKLIADCYQIIQGPEAEPTPAAEPVSNGHVPGPVKVS